jgi:GTP-binding protein
VNRPKDSRHSKLQFVTSAVNLQGCPSDTVPEVAMIGRSNAGKSSLINGIANSKIALVSSTPGKTRLLNFYQAERYRLVDMPGYGFAARGPDEQKIWQAMIESYLAARANLAGLVIVMDIRRDWSVDEKNLLKWLAPRELPCAVVLTKMDKLSKGVAFARVREIQKQSGVEHVFLTSALKKEGYTEFEDFLYLSWIKPL